MDWNEDGGKKRQVEKGPGFPGKKVLVHFFVSGRKRRGGENRGWHSDRISPRDLNGRKKGEKKPFLRREHKVRAKREEEKKKAQKPAPQSPRKKKR